MSDIMIKLKNEDDFMRVSDAFDLVMGKRNRDYGMYARIANEVHEIMVCVSAKFIQDKMPPEHYRQIATAVFYTIWRKHNPDNLFSTIKLDVDVDREQPYSHSRFVARYEHFRWLRLSSVLLQSFVTIRFTEAFEEAHDFLSQLVIDLQKNKTVSVDSVKFQHAMALADKLKGEAK